MQSLYTFCAVCLFIWATICPLEALQSPQYSQQSARIGQIPIHRVPLRSRPDDVTGKEPPFCYAVSSIIDLPSSSNFLATQVWPSARVAAHCIEQHASRDWNICELGCGPGLPSLTAAKLGHPRVFATDLDEFCLQLVDKAAMDQNLADRIQTEIVDLTWPVDEFIASTDGWSCKPDLFILSDVFENSGVAKGAAAITLHLLKQSSARDTRVWVFAQSDRAQREVYLQEMQTLTDDESLCWSPIENGPINNSNLWLCNLDELTVPYS